MYHITDYLVTSRAIQKLHEAMLKELCARYGLTSIEAAIISFLHNNPGKDTAGDIVELRMLSKGNVSQAVELLIQKGYLLREPDQKDRRRIHLHLTMEAAPITSAIDQIQEGFFRELLTGFSENDRQNFLELNARIRNNALDALKRRQTHERK